LARFSARFTYRGRRALPNMSLAIIYIAAIEGEGHTRRSIIL
jgi:hypothetical protein